MSVTIEDLERYYATSGNTMPSAPNATPSTSPSTSPSFSIEDLERYYATSAKPTPDLFGFPKHATPFFPSAEAAGNVAGIVTDAAGHLLGAGERLASSLYRGTETGLALKHALGDTSDKPTNYGDKLLQFSQDNLYSDEYKRQLQQGAANAATVAQGIKAMEAKGEIGEAEKLWLESSATAQNLWKNPALLGQGLSTAIPALAVGAITRSPRAASVAGGMMGGAEVLKNNQDFIEQVPQALLDQSPVYQGLRQKGLSDGEARYYLANDLTEYGWHVLAAGGTEAVLDRFLFNKLLKPGGGVLKGARTGAATEAVQEPTQTAISNDAVIRLAERLGIPHNKSRTDGLGSAAVLGTATGATVGAAGGLLSGKATPPQAPFEEYQGDPSLAEKQVAPQAVNEVALEEAVAPLRTRLGDEEADPLFDELKNDIQAGRLNEAVQSEDQEYAAMARAYMAKIGQAAEGRSETVPTPEISPPKTVQAGGAGLLQLGSQGAVPFGYRLMEADELTAQLKPNRYQNRDRNTADSQMQIAGYAAALNPAYLGSSVDVTQGAPTLDNRFGVFAGNGRLAAIQQAYAKYPQNAAAYKQYLQENAEQFGLREQEVARFKQPVLVRQVFDEIDIAKAVEEGNFNTGLDKGVLGNAKEYAQYLTDELLEAMEVNEDGSLNLGESNTPFIQTLISRIPVEHRPRFFAEKRLGHQRSYTLTAQGRDLVENALLVKAYSDGSSYADNLLTDLITGTEDGNKRVKAALTAITGKIIQTKGTEYDISAELIQAYDLMSKGKKAGLNATEAASQGDMLNQPSETVQGLVGLFYSPKSISEVQQPLNAYLDRVINSKLHQTEQSSLFEEENPTSEALLREAGLRFSRNNQPKSVSENIARGRQAMAFAINHQTDVANAMYREGLGWVDFMWGTEGNVNPNSEKRKGAKGVAHIIEKRMNVDHLTRDEVTDFLQVTVPDVIAKGQIERDYQVGDSRSVAVIHNGAEVHLIKKGNENAWLLTGFIQENRTMNQSRGATTSVLHTISPIRSRTDMGASSSNNLPPIAPKVNPQRQQDKATLERLLGKDIAAHIELIDGRQFAEMNRNKQLENLKDVEGFFNPHTGKAYIVTDQVTARNGLTRDENLAWVAWHELSHKGLAGRFGKQLQNALAYMGKNPLIAKLVKARQAMYKEEEDRSLEEVIVELSAAMRTGRWESIKSRYGYEVPPMVRRANSPLGKVLNTFERVLRRIVGAVIGRNLNADFAVVDLLSTLQQDVRDLAGNSKEPTAYDGESRYSLNEDDNSDFARAVDEVANGGAAGQKIVNVGTTPDVLKMLGLPDVDVIVHAKTLSKVMQDKHNVTPETLKQLPKQINNPVAVMKSGTQANGYVVLTELTEQENGRDKPVIAALHLKQDKNGLELLNIASVYGRSNSQIQRGLENDLLYWNKEKGAKFLDNFSLQLRSLLSENSSIPSDIKTEADLSQYQAENSVRYSFAGRHAQTANHSLLAQAESDLANGKDPETVRQETGWFKGVDGKWRFEIDDSQVTFKRDWDKRVTAMGVISSTEHSKGYNAKVTLGDILNAPELFAAYPDLADIQISYDEMKADGSYSPGDNHITLKAALPLDQIKSVLLHEIQHAIQDKEDFARGASSKMYENGIPDTQEMKGIRQEIAKLEQHYPHVIADVKATDLAISEWLNYDDGDAEVEQLLSEKAERMERALLGNEIAERYKALKWELGEARHKAGLRSAYNAYHNTAGEVEARNVQDRMDMTMAERQSVSPLQTQDTPEPHQIVRFDYGIADSLNEEPNSEFARAVDEVASGRTVKGYVNVGTTPDVLKMLGVPDVNVTIHGSTFKKVMQDKHNVTPETLKQLPQQINNPVAVMNSETRPSSYIVLTELTEQENGWDKPVIAALHLKQDTHGLELMNIASVYGRSKSQIQRGLNNDLLYWDNKKGTDFINTFGLQLPAYALENQSHDANIKTEADLSQYQAENSVRYSFAGRHAQTANHSLLAQAESDLANGKDPETVRQETGWFKGVGGKWRFEIDDSKAEFIGKQALETLAEQDAGMAMTPIQNVIQHPSLFEAYPKLAEIEVVYEASSEANGDLLYGAWFDPQHNQIVLGNGLDEQQLKSALLHELQHVIQTEESFAFGTSAKDTDYRKSAGEVEARNVQTRMNLTEEERLNRSPESTEDVRREEQIVRYADGSIANSLNEEPNSEFARAVDEVASGKQTAQQFIDVGTTPDVLKMLGLPDVNVVISGAVLRKVMQDKHHVTPETLKQLPKQINAPVAVMKSETQSNGYVVLTELTEREKGVDKPVIAALHLKRSYQGLELINIASVYGRSHSQIQRGLENDLLYWHKEKGAKFLDNLTLQLRSPLSSNSSIADNIKTEADLSQYRNENSDIRFSYKSPLEQMQEGRLSDEQEGFWADVLKGEFKSAAKTGLANVDEAIADETRPVDDWIRTLPIDPVTQRELISAKDRAVPMRMDLNSKVNQRFLTPLFRNIGQLADKHGLDLFFTKHLVEYWYSARYSIEKNQAMLAADKQAWEEAKSALQAAKANGDADAVQAAARAERRAKRKYLDREFTVNLNNWQRDEKGQYLIPRPIGVAGGWSIPQAKAMMAAAERYFTAAEIEAAMKPVQEAVRWNIIENFKAGRITEAQKNEYWQQPHYVPLTGTNDIETLDDALSGSGGKAVNTAKDKALKGRMVSEAEGAIDAVVGMLDKTNANTAWAEFKTLIDEVYEQALSDKLAQGLSKKTAKAEIEEAFGITKSKMKNMTRISDDVIIRKFEGVSYEYHLPENVVRALKGSSRDDAHILWQWITSPLGKVTGWIARGVTQYQPAFALTNMGSDVLDKSVLIQGEAIFDANGKALSNKAKRRISTRILILAPQMFKATGKFAWGDTENLNVRNRFEANLKELIELGGVSNYTTYLANTKQALREDIKRIAKPNSRAVNGAMHLVTTYNATFDYVSSLATYTALKEAGVDSKQAAHITLNLANFNKQGRFTKYFKPLYAFLNPSIQGNKKMLKMLATPAGVIYLGTRATGAYILYSIIAALASLLFGGDDELGNPLMSSTFAPREIQIPTGNGNVLRIPIGFGLPQLAWVTGVNLSKATSGQISPTEALANIVATSAKVITPVAPSEISPKHYPTEWLLNTFSPTAAKPFVQMATNRNAFGGTIYSSSLNSNLPKSLQSKAETAEIWKEAALTLYETVGWDMHPETYKHLFDSFRGIFGVVGQVVSNQLENPVLAARGKTERTAVLDRFYRPMGENRFASAYYQAKEEVKPLLQEFEYHKLKGDVAQWLKQHPEAQAKIQWAKQDEKVMGNLRKLKSTLEKARRDGRVQGRELISDKVYQQRSQQIYEAMEKVQRQQLHEWRKMEGLRTIKP